MAALGALSALDAGKERDSQADGEDGVKRPRLNHTNLEDLCDDLITKAVARSDAAWERRLPAIMEQLEAKIDQNILASEAKMEARIQELRQEVSAIKGRSSSPATSRASTSVAMTSAMQSLSLSSLGKAFVPTKIEVKGFIQNWKNRDVEALTRAEASHWLESVRTSLDQSAVALVDFDLSARLVEGRVLLAKIDLKMKEGMSKDACFIVKRGLQALWGSGACLIKGTTPRAVVEASPDRKPFINQGAKFLGILRDNGVPAEHLRPEWGPPVRIYDVRAERPVTIAEYSSGDGWNIREGPLKSVCASLTVEALQAALK